MSKFKNIQHLFSILEPSRLVCLDSLIAKNNRISIDIKRDDLIHPIISGNKWRKLKYLLMEIEKLGFRKVATMGGTHSNFLHALSYISYLMGWECELFVRGYSEQKLTPTLNDCLRWNAQLRFVDRMNFRNLRATQPELAEDVFWIEEGGQHHCAVKGISELFCELSKQYDYICMASATGTSVAGLITGVAKYQPQCKVIGISVLNNLDQQITDVRDILNFRQQGLASVDWKILSGYDFGGFAKKNELLDRFCSDFIEEHQIAIEPVYSGKSFFAVDDLIKTGYFEQGSKLLLVHCGGMQGARI